jgi:hypothetical protein
MSRTHRNAHKVGFYVYRYPRTFNERKQLETMLHDDEFALRNRDKSKINNLPTVYNDIVASGYYEDYSWKHYF